MELLVFPTNRIRAEDRVINSVRCDSKGHVAKRIAGRTCELRHGVNLLRLNFRNAEVGECGGQADVCAEAYDLLNLLKMLVLQHKLDERAEGDLLPVIKGMGFGDGGQAIVDGVRACMGMQTNREAGTAETNRYLGIGKWK